ncbi:MAG TPA: DUF1800 domain-containing protein [Burkholderiales bacterium]|nr:DUF1800 domain-containing protein [Burkholderiales bacterium]
MGAEEARHLLGRTGFEARIADIDALAPLTREAAVDRLLGGVRTTARTPFPEGTLEWVPPRRFRDAGPDERRRLRQQLVERGIALKAWWIGEMLATDSPLTERMTLFWHNHFTSSLQKVRSSALMARQNELLRRHALGSFAALLHAESKDPAMLVYLDGARSRRGQPNENFAREVMELFTLGEGRYTEQDIKEAARAFTGWSVEPDSGGYRWRPLAHDEGDKRVLGYFGNWRGEDVLDILLAEPATAEFVVAKLWKEFVSPQPDPREVARIAARFRSSGYQIRLALRELLLSDAFWAAQNRGALVKSPVELVVGTLREFEVRVPDPMPFAFLLRALGEDLFAPPNVKGWPGGDAWINSSTLLARKQFTERLLRVDEVRMRAPFSGREDMLPLTLLALPAAARKSLDPRELVADPVYQLK